MQQKVFKIMIKAWLLLTAPIMLHAQQVDSILFTAETKFPQEKMYLQTDKSTYNPGETIWFKTYINADNLPGPLSKTVYAELLNGKGIVLQRKMMPIMLSGAASDFILPDSMTDNHLLLRAYTSWMLNFDSSLLCVKPIYIIPKKSFAKKPGIPFTYSVFFFPEGGDLVSGIQSQVAFKATDQDGTPVAIKGTILNSQQKKISSFESVHEGMGAFSLSPEAGETYRAVWKDKNGVQHENKLPIAKKQGIVLAINHTDKKLTYTLTRSDSAGPEFKRFTVIAQTQQRLMYGAQINLTQRTTATAPIDTDSLADGVLQITVFNPLMKPVAERLVFVNNNNYSFVTDLHLIEKNISKRSRNVIQVDVGGSLLSNLSIAVTDADINPVGKNESSIYSQLLISSDLKGNVYNPAYYFSSDDDSVKQHLNLVMMTNGWRRFKWEDLLAEKWPVLNYLPEEYITLQGKIFGLSKTLLYNKALTAIVKTKNNPASFLTIPISAEGDFFQSSLYFFDTAKLYYQLTNDKDKNFTTMASFTFKNSFVKAPLVSKDLLSTFYLTDKSDSLALNKSSNLAALRRAQQLAAAKVETLQEVKVITKQKTLKQKLDEEYTSGFFSGNDGYTFSMQDDPMAKSSPSVLAYLQGKVAGLQINTTGNGSATWRGSATSFFLNESQADISMLQSINMADVALIKVFRPPFFGASGGGSGGAIAIYTNKGASTNAAFVGLPSTNIYGYSVIREFYSPDYNTNPDPFTKDYRSTLYWNPHIYIDKNNRRITLPFFNSDNCKKIRVIVEGINENGLLTREEKIFEP